MLPANLVASPKTYLCYNRGQRLKVPPPPHFTRGQTDQIPELHEPDGGAHIRTKVLPQRRKVLNQTYNTPNQQSTINRTESLETGRGSFNFDPELIPACVKMPCAPQASGEGRGWERSAHALPGRRHLCERTDAHACNSPSS